MRVYFTIPSIQSTFLELFATLEGIGTIGCSKFIKFTEENKRIMAVNSKTQEEYGKKLDAFCYYSEVLRTLTVHQYKLHGHGGVCNSSYPL